ncbi:MAG: DUF1499 domain-containing protein [Gammaproteobacteria bacterium]|nr:DUF1499 domain-containing protein [Gammaproteobacteria bacterium]MYF60759.1 DUF1499 domain-containing protein [Gammaproteobacteria bacterium]MYI22875.1 DUF1499 domain-containing protein [Gammaproteobacteria bacterium]
MRVASVSPTGPPRGDRLSQELSFTDRLKRALVATTSRTSADATDPRLVGRTYAIPFAQVWEAVLDLVRGELPRWHARWWDEEEGVIHALTRGRLSRRASDVVIRIGLDVQAQTRVDLRSTSRSKGLGDFGSNTRLIGTFIGALDRKLTRPQAPPAPARKEPVPAQVAGDNEPPPGDYAPVEVVGSAVEEGNGEQTAISRHRARSPRRRVSRRGPRSRLARGRRGVRGPSRRSGNWRKDRSRPEAPAAGGTALDPDPRTADGNRAPRRRIGCRPASRSRSPRGGRRGQRR